MKTKAGIINLKSLLKKKKRLFFERVEISDIGAEGKAIARIDNVVTFVSLVAPGDIVDLEIIKKRSRYMEARVTKFHKLSELREKPVCKHFGICGGCRWQHLQYPHQLKYKQNQVVNALLRIGKLQLPEINPIIASRSIYLYRNKLEFAFSNRRWLPEAEIVSGQPLNAMNGLGFHVPRQFDKVVNIEECWLQPEPSNHIRNEVRKVAEEHNMSFFNPRNHAGFLRNLIIRTSSNGEVMVILSFFQDDEEKRDLLMGHLQNKFPGITSLMFAVNNKGNDTLYDLDIHVFSGMDHITEEFEGLKFRIGAKSFFQTNTTQSLELYRIVRNSAGLRGHETVYDLYTGTGTIANFIAQTAGKVIGIESVPEAVEDAKRNSAINGIHNTIFLTGDMKEMLTPSFTDQYGSPEIIITDPPRSGMHRRVAESILRIRPEKIIYVSCNPATQARDLEILSASYKINMVQPVDMFPQTNHVENVVSLIRK